MSKIHSVPAGTVASIQSNTQLKGITMNTIAHMQVVPQGIHNEQLEILGSEAVKKAIYKAAIFGTTQSLLNAAQKLQTFSSFITRLENSGMKDKAESIKVTPRYMDTEVRAINTAQRLAILHGLSDAKGFNIDIELTPSLKGISNSAVIAEKAKWARMPEAEVAKIEATNNQKQYDAQMSAVQVAEMLFFSAETEEEQLEYEEEQEFHVMKSIPVYFHPESALKSAIQTRNWLLGWNNPDYTELGLISQDIDTLEAAVAKFQQITEQAGEQSREMDDKAASSADLIQGSGQ